MKKSILFLNILLSVSLMSMNRQNICISAGTLLTGVAFYTAYTISTHNKNVPKAFKALEEFKEEFKKEDLKEEDKRTKLGQYSSWYFETYGEIPYSIIPVHTNRAEIIAFFNDKNHVSDNKHETLMSLEAFKTRITKAAEYKAKKRSYNVPIFLATPGISLLGWGLYKFLKSKQ